MFYSRHHLFRLTAPARATALCIPHPDRLIQDKAVPMYPVSIKGVLILPSSEVVLLQNHRNEWELPGGRIERNESPKECLEREFLEELQASIHVCEPLDSYLFEVIPRKHVFIVTYRCTLTHATHFRYSDEHQTLGLFPLDALPPNLPTGYRRSIQHAAQTA